MRLLPQSSPSGRLSRPAHWSRTLLALPLSLAVGGICHAQVISEVYGGGGNSGAPYLNDFVELYNPTAAPVSLAGYAVQYAPATSTSWTVVNLSGSIPANAYYLVQLGSGGAIGNALPAPDATGSVNIAATGGKIALTNTQTALTGAGIPQGNVVDFVGYDSSASSFEGTAPAPAGSNTTSIARNASNTDSNNNATDFTAGAPSPAGPSIDSIAPTVAMLNPADGSTTATTTQNLVITFSEPVIKGTGNITIKLTTGGSTVETIDVASVSVSGATVTIDPVNDLLANTAYYINIPNTAFKDGANNFYDGIANTSSWNFSIPAPAGTLVAGDIAFVGLANASDDHLSFVALKAIPAGEVIRFTDNEWNGSAIGSGGAFTTTEGYINWNSPGGGVPQGTVVRLDNLALGTRSASTGTLTTSGSFNITNLDTVYAFQGGATSPTRFLAVVTNNGITDSVANTGLTASNIVSLTSTTSHYQYTGPRSSQPSFSSYLTLISDSTTNWTTSPSTDDPAVTFAMASFTIGGGNTFATWITQFNVGTKTGPNDDYDGDGIANTLENYMGSNPSMSNTGLNAVSGTAASITFRHSRADAPASEITASYEWSVDLLNWFPSGTGAGITVIIGAPTVITDGSPNDLVEVTASVPPGSASKLFARLKGVKTP